MTNIREELAQKLDKLSTEQVESVYQFVEFLEYKQQSVTTGTPITNEDIDKSYAKGKFTVPDDFNDPLPDEIIDLFEPK